ncbi:hypothetical protein GASC598B02_000760, partial [Gilliamella apicola SCGC AB-598-B02]
LMHILLILKITLLLTYHYNLFDFKLLIDDDYYDEAEKSIVKQADALCAYLKTIEELSAGNNEFRLAEQRLKKTLSERNSPEMDYFLEVFVPSFKLSLDEITMDN